MPLGAAGVTGAGAMGGGGAMGRSSPVSAYHSCPRYVCESTRTTRPWANRKSLAAARLSDLHFGQRFTLAAATTSVSVLPPGAGGAVGLGAAAGPGAGAGGTEGLGAAGGGVGAAGAGAAGVAAAGFGGAALGVDVAGFAAAGAAGVAGLGAAAGAAGGPGAAGLGAAGAGAVRSSSQMAAHTPQVWILLVKALHACGPQLGQ